MGIHCISSASIPACDRVPGCPVSYRLQAISRKFWKMRENPESSPSTAVLLPPQPPPQDTLQSLLPRLSHPVSHLAGTHPSLLGRVGVGRPRPAVTLQEAWAGEGDTGDPSCGQHGAGCDGQGAPSGLRCHLVLHVPCRDPRCRGPGLGLQGGQCTALVQWEWGMGHRRSQA